MSSSMYLSYTELEALMRTQIDALEGFDVLVSYTETELNNLLKAGTANDSLNIPEFVAPISSFPNPKTTYVKCDFTLEQPNFSFAGASKSATADLSFHVSGSLSFADLKTGPWGDAVPLPKGLVLTIVSQLSTVTGSVDAANPHSRFVPADLPTHEDGDNSAYFDQQDQKSAIVLYIPKNGGVTFSGDGTVDPNLTLFLQSSDVVKSGLETYFAGQAWFYYLAIVSNSAPAENKSNYQLQPTSFGFTVCPGNGSKDPATKIDNVLSMWITVKGGSGSAVLHPGEACNADFNANNLPRCPIPVGQGSTASIIFSHKLMKELLFQPALELAGCTGVEDDPEHLTGPGMKLLFNFPSYTVAKVPLDWSNTSYFGQGSSTTQIRKIDGFSFDMSSIPAIMTMSPGLSVKGQSASSIQWIGPSFSLNWISDVDTTLGNGGGYEPDDGNGLTDLSFSLQGQGLWLNNNDPEADVLDFKWTLPENFDIALKAETDKASWWKRLYDDWKNQVPADYADLTYKVPDLSTDFSINYFLATNLLLPGQHVFLPDPLVADNASVEKGISLPYDCLLTGSVAVNSISKLEVSPSGSLSLCTKPRISQGPRPRHRRHQQQARRSARRTHRVNGNGAITGGDTIMPSLNNSETVSSAKTVDDFVAALLSQPNILMGKLLTACGQDSVDDAIANTLSILTANGYGNLTADEVYAVLGTSVEQVTKQLSGSASQHMPERNTLVGNAQGGIPAFDLRVFGGSYKITTPDTLEDQRLVVSYTDGTIAFINSLVYPTITTNAKVVPAKTTVSWASGTTKYAIVFTSMPAEDVAFSCTFSGTVTYSGQDSQSFDGKQVQASSLLIPEKDWQIIDQIFGLIGITSFAAACLWRRNDNKHADEIAGAENKRKKGQDLTMTEALRNRASDYVNKIVEDRGIPWPSFQDHVDGSTTSVLDTFLASKDADYIEAMEAGRNQGLQDLRAEGGRVISETIKNDTYSSGVSQVASQMAEWVTLGYISKESIRDISKEALDRLVTEKAATLTASKSYLQDLIEARIASRKADIFEKAFTTSDASAKEWYEAAGSTVGEIEGEKQKKTLNDVKLQEPDLPESEIARLTEANKELEVEIGKLTERYQEQSRESEGAGRSREIAEHGRDGAQEKRSAKEGDAQHRLQEVLRVAE